MSSHVSIADKSNGKPLGLPFARMKDAILGKDYELSVAIVTPKESERLNRTYRQKDKPANVLSFPFSKKAGELILDPKSAAPQAKDFDMSPKQFLRFLVIHGMLHLKGYDHGSTMEKEERKFLKLFSKK